MGAGEVQVVSQGVAEPGVAEPEVAAAVDLFAVAMADGVFAVAVVVAVCMDAVGSGLGTVLGVAVILAGTAESAAVGRLAVGIVVVVGNKDDHVAAVEVVVTVVDGHGLA